MDAAFRTLGPCDGRVSRSDLAGVPRRPTSAAEAAAVLEVVTARLQGCGDPRAAFCEVYGVITRLVAEILVTRPGFFQEPAWISRLAGRFCERYVETLDGSTEALHDCDAWAVSHGYAGRRATVPIQEAMLGLSAHINYDLAIGIFQNIVELGGRDDARQLARYRHDHDAVNELLRAAMQEALERLARDHHCVVSALLDGWARPVARWLVMQVLVRWRARVWREVLGLLAAPGEGERAARIRRMDRRASRLGRLLAAPSAIYLGLRGLFGQRVARA